MGIFTSPNSTQQKVTETTYTEVDCISETLEHIHKVQEYMMKCSGEINYRALVHDASKIQQPELAMFTELTPKLANMTYGSDEYEECRKQMQETALKHHYENNSHHPEHYENGIAGMNLFDLIEMMCDWKAATLRHKDGDIAKSLEINAKRFDISPQLQQILANTIEFINK